MTEDTSAFVSDVRETMPKQEVCKKGDGRRTTENTAGVESVLRIEVCTEARVIVIIKDDEDEADQNKTEEPTVASGSPNDLGSGGQHDSNVADATNAPMIDAAAS